MAKKKAKGKAKGKKVNKKKSRWVFRLIFLLGFLVMVYPLISRFYYRIESNEQVETFSTGAKKLDTKEIDRRINLAKAFNDSLSGKIASFQKVNHLSLIHISEPTRPCGTSRMPSSA